MTYQTFLKLGRVSNLPTVWTNAIAGTVLAGQPSLSAILIVGCALTLFYVGGMWLNDAFDAEIDGIERANRPIPMSEISVGTVFSGGFAMLGLGILLAFSQGVTVGLAGLCLAAAVVLYDWLHKRTALSPVIMGVTRFFCYIVAALAVGQLTGSVVFGALGLLAYTAGLTYAAKQEAYDRLDRAWPLAVLALPLIYALMQTAGDIAALAIWVGLLVVVLLALRRLFRRNKGDVPTAVVTMIAGMSLYDATLIAGTGQTGLAVVAVAGFGLTLYLQRVVSGT
ncbi:UbiA family prenyltransferase [Falsiphaeobacter marinintestinus]|uniref:UbiA family prenyltransferase n=1 Tax=Falsiphaeobacter marinintestinus TaxID=1492905 RepID=UPI0011B824BE|nr:UbiA family prenyltransferase [Phaeobacter marinintestinus]